MSSSKGEPTDPELREKVKEEVKGESKGWRAGGGPAAGGRAAGGAADGGGAGKWSAWKAGEMARRYEDAGGDYRDTGSNKNEAKKGAPVKKEGK
ncbi:hypothetical protein LTR91_015354 [Friedmanniomyces endolithicus]|uniref:Uncharacterized protein n=1 Tax=Friedmanniomyces endolithicus TaxID=329885 RepID=A0AAN6KA09_9PEZI|nr:hypothetical protein LTR91_015354 [Friedmanniomyces endolithicus]